MVSFRDLCFLLQYIYLFLNTAINRRTTGIVSMKTSVKKSMPRLKIKRPDS